MTVRSVETYALSIPRSVLENVGGAGSPASLRDPAARYSRALNYGTVYSSHLETTLVKITTTEGVVGWGEAQAPVLPEVTKSIIDGLLADLLLEAKDIAPIPVRESLFSAMNVRGHCGGFYIDALSAIDCALWDIAGKRCNTPVCQMIGGSGTAELPTYTSGLIGKGMTEQMEYFGHAVTRGTKAFKVFLTTTTDECLELVRAMRKVAPEVRIFVDALWRLRLTEAIDFAISLKPENVSWLESPLDPGDIEGHKRLAIRSPIPIAMGESYRTVAEVLPFMQGQAMQYLQPDIGRAGITEAMRMSAVARAFHIRLAPHISVGLGPQIASALHVAACWPGLETVECNPQVYQLANQFLLTPLRFSADAASVPLGSGLGIDIDEAKLSQYVVGGRS